MQTRNTDSKYFLFISARPQGKSYLFFTQFKAELKGTKIEYANAYVSMKKLLLELLLGLCAFICFWAVNLSQCSTWTKLKNFVIAAFFFFVLLSLLFITVSGLIPFPEEDCPSVMLLKPGLYLLWTLRLNIHSTWFFKKLAGVRLQVWLVHCRVLFFGLVLEDANYWRMSTRSLASILSWPKAEQHCVSWFHNSASLPFCQNYY